LCDNVVRSAYCVEKALDEATAGLRAITDSPRLEAEVLLARILEHPRTFLLAHPEAALTPEQAARFTDGVGRRAAGVPLPYITGHIEFYGLDFAVTPDVLIPRPETELLVEEALAWLKSHPTATVVDVGTGSGCIAVTLAIHTPDAHFYATDISAAALDVARANAERHGVRSRITFLVGDLLSPLTEPVDVLVSNPPYVAETEWDALPLSVRQEPRLALTSGVDGLDAIRRLLAQAVQRVRPGGLILIEIGGRQGDTAQALAQAAFPQASVQVLPDLAGKARVLKIF